MGQLFFGTDGSALSKPEDVIPFLGKQHLHWKKGRSAYETAHSWFTAQGLPNEMRQTLVTDHVLAGATLRKAIFENKTELDAFGRPSQTDVLALLQTNTGLAVLGVEAKVDETFGSIVREWNDQTVGKSRRLVGLCKRLELNPDDVGSLRYQLLHRTVATLLESERHGAVEAALVIQSFSPNHIRAGFDDFRAFSAALGTPIAEPATLAKPIKLHGINLRLGWIESSLHVEPT